MTLWRRAPREVYRVYGEDEYLSADEQQVAEHSPSALAVEPTPGSHSGRLVGIGLLVGVSVAAIGLVVVNVGHRLPDGSSGGTSQDVRSHAGHHSVTGGRSEDTRQQRAIGLSAPNHAATASDVSASALAGEQTGRIIRNRVVHARAPFPPVLSSPQHASCTRTQIECAPRRLWLEQQPAQTSNPVATSANASLEGEFDFER